MIGLYGQEFFLRGLLFMDCFTIRPGKSKTIKSRNIFKYDFTKKNSCSRKEGGGGQGRYYCRKLRNRQF